MIFLMTERLIIRDHVYTDLEDMHRLLSDSKAMYYLSDIKTETINETKDNLDLAISEANSTERQKYFFAIIDKLTSEYIGEIGFHVVTESPKGNNVNLGYFILPEYWGNGYVFEAVKKVIDFAFRECNVHKVVTGCLRDNKASENIMMKSKMIKEGNYIQHVWHDGHWKDRVEYRLLKEEWERAQ